MTEIKQSIPARLKNMAVGGHVAGADDIIDDALGKEQSEINQEVSEAIDDLQTSVGTGGSVDKRIAAAKSSILGNVSDDYNTLKKIEDKTVQNTVDIDDLDSDLVNLENLVNEKQMDIGATEFDIRPKSGSSNPVTSGGIYTHNVEAEIVVGDPAGDWEPASAEAMFERNQQRINILETELQAAQLEIGAVATDTEPVEDSVNMLPSGAIYNLLQNLAVAGEIVDTI